MCMKPPVYRAVDLFRCAIQKCSTHSKKQTPPIWALMLHYIRSCSSWFIHDQSSLPDPILSSYTIYTARLIQFFYRKEERAHREDEYATHEPDGPAVKLPKASGPLHLLHTTSSNIKKRGTGRPQPSSSSAHLSRLQRKHSQKKKTPS